MSILGQTNWDAMRAIIHVIPEWLLLGEELNSSNMSWIKELDAGMTNDSSNITSLLWHNSLDPK